jgi:GDPmannose 4,6-dehydratase
MPTVADIQDGKVIRRALITGITGQDGSYLAEQLVERGYYVYGLVRRTSHPNFENLRGILTDPDPLRRGRLTLVAGDVTDPASVSGAIAVIQPHEIYNLAAMSFVGTSWAQARLTFDVNAMGFLNVLEAAKAQSMASRAMGLLSAIPDPRVYQASTSEMFGATKPPQNEDSRLSPRSPYGIAKLTAHELARVYRESHGMYVATGILFNHESPRRGLEFVTRKIARAVARIQMGLERTVELGDLSAQRDWGYAPEYTEAMWLILRQRLPSDFVIGTGQTHSVREFVIAAFAAVGGHDPWPYVGQRGTLLRPAEIPVLRADCQKARTLLGWRPTVMMTDLVRRMVDAELAALAAQPLDPLRVELIDPRNLPPVQ